MQESSEAVEGTAFDDLYKSANDFHLNTEVGKVHAKRMPGRFRTFKWITASVWLVFFLFPYLRWGDRQAILLDIPARKFHIFDLTILPQDVWMLAMVLLFFAILLAVVTSIAGRVFCGFFCFQTVWTDVYTWIEDRLEGAPHKRRKLDKAPWNAHKVGIKATKHFLWLAIAMLTGVSFAAWFTDAYQLWADYVTLQAPFAAWVVLGMFTGGTYLFAGFMREQVCFWLCPYARIQGVMYDRETILPSYDYNRGEPRGKLKKGQKADAADRGDCIDCSQCVQVCPTGIDIRHGQQEGCITCALCIDACDSVMDKVGLPRGLIRYASLAELEGRKPAPLFKRPRVLVYTVIILAAISGLAYGLSTLAAVELKVLHARQPLFVRLSDGSIQNRYELKVLNKTDQALQGNLTVTGIAGATFDGVENPIPLEPGDVTSRTLFVQVPADRLNEKVTPIRFVVETGGKDGFRTEYESMFQGPRP